MLKKTISIIYLLVFVSFLYADQYELKSPDGKLSVKIDVGQKISYTLYFKNEILIHPSEIAMYLDAEKSFGINSKVKGTKLISKNGYIDSPVYKKSRIQDHYNELTIAFKENFSIIFRAYDEGVAYRFVSSLKKDFLVMNEIAEFNFGQDRKAYIPYVKNKGNSFEEQFFHSFENTYSYQSINCWDIGHLAFLPLLVECDGGEKVCITEADLMDYPGMYLNNPDRSNTLKAVFAPYPKTIDQGGHNHLQGLVKEYESYIAKSKGNSNFPWRVMIVSSEDKDLANNDMVYKLASPNRLEDVSWIKPGKVAWDWWNDWNLYGVDFKTGVNNETYKYYIDFASANNIEYVILDEGWAVHKQADLMQVVPEINLPVLLDYAKSKNVEIILWAGYWAFNRDMENVCRHYSAMGVKGFKVDFMDRDDQPMVNFHYKAAETAAKYKLLLDFHGTYKPTGLQRTFPNVINFEGVHGLEHMKWEVETVDQVTYDVTIPFIRQIAGPMDYTQGAMRNASKSNYRPVNSEPMSQGTRCHQLAQYVIFESPLNMLCDNPSNYEKEHECTAFISLVPTVWDETIVLDGKIAGYISIARRKGNEWYVGTLTNWDKREIELDLSFLGSGNFKAEIFKDGINADKAASDYKRELIDIPSGKKITIKMAPGGGFVARLFRE